MLFPEYGARVKITMLYEYPDGAAGTIVSDPAGGLAIVRLDFNGECGCFAVEEFDVSLAPSESAWRMTQRWSVDELLKAIEEMPDVMGDAANPGRTYYSTALVFELYRLNAHAEAVAALGFDDDDDDTHAHDAQCDDEYCPELDGPDDGGWESGACDDGYGYPVYAVED